MKFRNLGLVIAFLSSTLCLADDFRCLTNIQAPRSKPENSVMEKIDGIYQATSNDGKIAFKIIPNGEGFQGEIYLTSNPGTSLAQATLPAAGSVGHSSYLNITLENGTAVGMDCSIYYEKMPTR